MNAAVMRINRVVAHLVQGLASNLTLNTSLRLCDSCHSRAVPPIALTLSRFGCLQRRINHSRNKMSPSYKNLPSRVLFSIQEGGFNFSHVKGLPP